MSDSNTPNIALPFFEELLPENISRLVTRFNFVRNNIKENTELHREFCEGLSILGLKPPDREMALPNPELVKGKISNHPLAALLATPSPTEIALAEKFERLSALIIATSVILRAKGHGEYRSPISNASNAVRLIANKGDFLTRLPHFPEDIYLFNEQLINLSNGTHRFAIDQQNRMNDWRVLTTKYVEKLPETTRSRAPQQVNFISFNYAGQEDKEVFQITNPPSRTKDQKLESGKEFDAEENNYDLVLHFPRSKGTDPVSRDIALQETRNKHFSHRIVVNRKLLNSGWERLRKHEALAIRKNSLKCLQECRDVTSKEFIGCLLIALSIVTGRPPVKLGQLVRRDIEIDSADEYWLYKDGVVFLAYKPDIPRNVAPNEIRENGKPGQLLTLKKSQPYLLPVPQELQPYLKKHLRQKNKRKPVISSNNYLLEDCIHPSLKALTKDFQRPISLGKISSFLPGLLKHLGTDDLIAAYITGAPPTMVTGLYYTQLQSSVISEKFDKALKTIGLTIPAMEAPSYTVGSVLVPDDDKISKVFNRQKKSLENLPPLRSLSDWITYHNQYALYVYQVLTLTTGHRPVRAPFGTLMNFDLTAGFLFISDKESLEKPTPRIIPLCQLALEQTNVYLAHLEAFAQTATGLSTQIRQQASASLEGDVPLLFFIDEQYNFQPLDPGVLKETSSLPLNWQRHWLRSKLTTSKTGKSQTCLSGELINAFMGHGQFGQEYFNPSSGGSFFALQKVANHIDALMAHLKIEVYK